MSAFLKRKLHRTKFCGGLDFKKIILSPFLSSRSVNPQPLLINRYIIGYGFHDHHLHVLLQYVTPKCLRLITRSIVEYPKMVMPFAYSYAIDFCRYIDVLKCFKTCLASMVKTSLEHRSDPMKLHWAM